MLCKYGCGKEANFMLKNGDGICSEYATQCPKNIEKNKNSRTVEERSRCLDGYRDKPKKEKIKCQFCGKIISKVGIKSHEENCFLNPSNKKQCPICGDFIQNFRQNTTCSKSCSNKYYRQRENHPNWKGGMDGYREYCLKNHGNKCVVCGEDKIVVVHHIDENRSNNKLENLAPLCPTHHAYMHQGFSNEIIDVINEKIKRVKYVDIYSIIFNICIRNIDMPISNFY